MANVGVFGDVCHVLHVRAKRRSHGRKTTLFISQLHYLEFREEHMYYAAFGCFIMPCECVVMMACKKVECSPESEEYHVSCICRVPTPSLCKILRGPAQLHTVSYTRHFFTCKSRQRAVCP
jgi:hypothetical protein